MQQAAKSVKLPGPFKMYRGGQLPEVELVYETWGTLSPERDNVVLLFTGLSPSAHAASSPQDPSPGWWEYMIGPGKPLDTDRFHIICVNSLGSCFGSTGPASINPCTGQRYAQSFPELSIEDIAAAARQALHVLGIEHLHTVMGPSLGGMTALCFAVDYPSAIDNLVLISSAASAAPSAIAIRSLQREVIRSDGDWMGGDYDTGKGPKEGMRLARKIGLMSYRSAEEWRERFGRERVAPGEAVPPFGIEFQIEAYLDANARKFIGDFDANCYLYLSRSMDWFDLSEHADNLEDALARIRAKHTLVIGVDTDFLFPIYQQREIAELLQNLGRQVEFIAMPSLQGHDAFLSDQARFARAVEQFLSVDTMDDKVTSISSRSVSG